MDNIFCASKYTLSVAPHAHAGVRGDQPQASSSYPFFAPPMPAGPSTPPARSGHHPPPMWGMSPYYPAPPPYYPMMPQMYSLPPSMYAPNTGYPAAYPPPSSYHPYPSSAPHAHHTHSMGDASPSHNHCHTKSSPPSS